MNPKVFFRADAGPQTGLGHLVRCSALAHMLKKDFNIVFFCREYPESIGREFAENGFDIIRIKSESDFLRRVKSDLIVVLDGYDFDADYQQAIKRKGAKLVCIDDLHDKEFFADLIINHAPGIKPQDYRAQPYAQFALGPEYALLRPGFLEQAKKERRIEKIEVLLILFGGADPKGLTEKALQIAIKFRQFKKIIVVTGSAHISSELLKLLVSSDRRIDHRPSLGEKEILLAMLEADLAIVHSGGVLYEALAAGCRIISGRYADNQKFIYEGLNRAELIIDAGSFKPGNIQKAISKALDSHNPGGCPIDGHSKGRLLKYFQQLQTEKLVALREATEEDLGLTYGWASNKEIRRYSFQKHQITRTEHTNWFLGKIDNPKCAYFIGDINEKPFGSIRFDLKNGEAMISYQVDPTFYGQGLGQILLKKGIEDLLMGRKYPVYKLKTISGFVMKSNIPSIKAFNRLGFKKIDLEDKYKFDKKL